MSIPATPQEIATRQKLFAEFNRAKQLIYPAMLRDTKANGNLVNHYLLTHSLTGTADNFVTAFNALYAEIDWAVKPAKLLRDEAQAAAKPNAKGHLDEAEEFQSKLKNADQKIQQDRVNEALVKQMYQIIGAFRPIRAGREMFGLQGQVQQTLTKYIHDSITNTPNVSREQMLVKIKEYIENEYQKLEKSGERV
jgi:hypothetical protein